MKKIIISIVVIILIGGVGYTVYRQKSNNLNKEWEIFESKETGIRIKYPKNWHYNVDEYYGTMSISSLPHSFSGVEENPTKYISLDISYANSLYMWADNTEQGKIDEFNEMKENLALHYKISDFEIVEEEIKDGKKYLFRMVGENIENPEDEFYYLNWMFVRDGDEEGIFWITATVSPKIENQYEDIASKIMDSFEFIE